MKIEIEDKKLNKCDFPYLGKHIYSDCVVFFNDEESGTIIMEDKKDENRANYNVGDYRTDWLQDNFILFNGVIKLSNGE